MKRGARTTTLILAGVALLLASVWSLTTFTSMKSHIPDPPRYHIFSRDVDSTSTTPTWIMVIYLDVDACLSCTEDMNGWRELEQRLNECGGVLSLWAPREDSADVAWAMKMEGLHGQVRVLDRDVVAALGWAKLGTPVKVLLDSNCQPVKIAGRMGNVRESECFFKELFQQIDPDGRLAAVSD